MKVLVIEDEKDLLEVTRDYLIKEGYDTKTALSGIEALKIYEAFAPDLIITDLMLPDISGEEITALIREKSNVPIIMLTAKTQTEDRINGLTVGADDYITKPFSLRELMLRVKKILERTYGNQTINLLNFPELDLKINVDARTVSRFNEDINLTKFEFELLVVMAENPNRAFSREQLIESSAGYDYFGYDRTIDTHIKNLRKKIHDHDKNHPIIKTVYGVGYKFNH